jgi:hypothetical protein
MDDDAKIEAAAKKLVLGLLTGEASLEVVQVMRVENGHPRPAWSIRFVPPNAD